MSVSDSRTRFCGRFFVGVADPSQAEPFADLIGEMALPRRLACRCAVGTSPWLTSAIMSVPEATLCQCIVTYAEDKSQTGEHWLVNDLQEDAARCLVFCRLWSESGRI